MEVNTMIYTEEDLEQAYAIGYNEAVDDVNEYIDQESMEFSLDESYDDDYSAVEDIVCMQIKTKKVNLDLMILLFADLSNIQLKIQKVY